MDKDTFSSSDTSNKRKIEDDTVSPKPNTKRIKLVRPVFCSVAKPNISTINETHKIDVHTTEVPKSINISDPLPNVANILETEKSFNYLESIKTPNVPPSTVENTIDPSETVKKSVELPKTTVEKHIKLPDTDENIAELSEHFESSVESPEIVQTPIKPSENIIKPCEPFVREPLESHVATFVSSVDEADSSSDPLDIPNIFSEETKKELENLKKNIFKIEDDGSSSENDSQPSKRPRLKRPTFVTAVNENKVESSVESNNSTTINKTNETFMSSDLLKSSSIYSPIETQLISKDNKGADEISTNIEEEKLCNNGDQNVVKKIIAEIQKVDQLSEDKSTVIKVEEKKPTQFQSVHKSVEKETSVTKKFDSIEEENIYGIENINEIPQKMFDDEYSNTNFINIDPKTDNNQQEKIDKKEKVMLILNDQELVDKEKAKQLIDQTRSIEISSEEHGKEAEVLRENIESIEVNNVKNAEVALKKFVDRNNTDLSTDKTEFDIKNKISDETFNEELSDKCNTNEDEDITKINVECTVINEMKMPQINQSYQAFKVSEDLNSENEKQKSCTITLVENKNNHSFDIPSNLKYDEHESQMFKSDILKAALMSNKSLESLVSIPEDQHNKTPSKTKETEILPTIGQEAIVNKIEAEIILSTKDQPTNDNILQNKILSNVPEIKIPKEISISNYNYENLTIKRNDEPPIWGSAKMNEVEKFLNDSNVTITPIVKHQETPKLGKITLKLPKIGNPEIKSETTLSREVKSELLKKIVNNRVSVVLPHPSETFKSFAAIQPIPKPSAQQIALLEQQILNTPKKRGRPSKALVQQKQLLLHYQQQLKIHSNVETSDVPVFHAPLFDMEDMSGRTGMFDSFNASTPKRTKSSRGRKGRGGCNRTCDESFSDLSSKVSSMNDEGESYQEELNEVEETKQVALIEAERLRKEELREKKLEDRKKKLKERSDLLKEKKLKKKQRAEERRLQWHEKKRLMQEEKARAAEMKKSLPPPQNFDDETRMSADCNNSHFTSARNFMLDDDLSISGATNDSIRMKKGRMEVIDLESNKTLTVDQIAEYQWPLEGGELYMIQEQISNFLGVKSFKRKYPGLKRRNVEAEERTFLCDSGLVAETLCDLGLTVLYSSEVLDIMYADFPEKYEELREYMRLKHAKELSNRQRALVTISSNTDGSKLDLRDRAMEAAANWNANFNKSRFESRKCSMDMQTFIVHYPKNKCKKMTIPQTKIGSYPLALLPGQFSDYYATYSNEDLRYLPLNTVLYGPLKSVDKDFTVSLSSQSESEDSSSDDSSDSDDSNDLDNKSGTNGLECGPSDKKGAECKVCLGTAEKNKKETAEPLIHCSKCLTIYHPTCLEMTLEMVPHIKRYNWQCNDCKSCAQCKELADEDKILFCDLCDRGYHIYCVGLRKVPEGRWHCQECAMCSSCGVSDPGPGDSKWFYEFKRVEKTGSKVYCRTLCAPCSRSWKKGHYCPNCMRCYSIKNIERMAQCNGCDKFIHPECISENHTNRQVVTCTICEEKAVSRLLTTVPRSLIKV